MIGFIRRWYFSQIATWALVFKQRDIAFDYYAKIIAERPDDTLTLSRVAFLHAEAGDHAAAVRGFERVVSIRPDDADGWFNLGYLHQQHGDHGDAIRAFERATTIKPGHDLSWYGQGLSLVALKRDEDAIKPFKENIRLQPMSPHGFMELARVYFRLGDSERCEKQMRRLKAFDPKNAAALEDETGIRIGVERWWKT